MRYDSGRRRIIDPLVQKTREYVQPDDETFQRLNSEDYRNTVSERVKVLLETGEMRLGYDGQEGTLHDYRRYIILAQGNLGT